MPSRSGGIGTRCWGQRERGPDGSFITTEWFVFFNLPVIPLRSMRVLPGRTTTRHVSGGTVTETELLSTKVPLSWRQVLNVYASFIGIVGAILLSLYLIGHYL